MTTQEYVVEYLNLDVEWVPFGQSRYRTLAEPEVAEELGRAKAELVARCVSRVRRREVGEWVVVDWR